MNLSLLLLRSSFAKKNTDKTTNIGGGKTPP